MTSNKVKIVQSGPRDVKVFIDGTEVHCITKVEYMASVEEISTVKLEFIPFEDVEIDVDADVSMEERE